MSNTIETLQQLYGTSSEELHMLNIQRLGLSQPDLDQDIIKQRVIFRVGDDFFHKPIINNIESPYRVLDKQIYFNDQLIPITLERKEEDTVKPYYFRGDKILVINSTVFGPCNQKCVFCEQNNAPKEKRRYSLMMDEFDLFNLVSYENSWFNCESLTQISVVASCAGTEEKALQLISRYKGEAVNRGFAGKMLFATNEIRSTEGVKKFAQMKDMILAFTVECFSNRNIIMPGEKGSITLPEIKTILKTAKDNGAESTYFYIFGIDNLENTREGFEFLKESITIAPTGPNYQPQGKDNKLEINSLEHLLKSREIYFQVHQGMEKFESCQNYRSLWPLEKKDERTLV